MAGRQGPSERRSRPRLREKGPAAVAVERIAPTGRTAPKAPAGDIEYVNLTKIKPSRNPGRLHSYVIET